MAMYEHVCKNGHVQEHYYSGSIAVPQQVPCDSKGCDEMAQLREYSLPAKRNPRYGIQ